MEVFVLTIQNRIKQIREYFRLFQEQFAQRINRSYALISLIETGRKKVSEETAERICSEFSVNKEWLLNGEGDMTASDPIDRENMKYRIRQIRKNLKLSQEEFGSAVGFCKQRISYIENGRVFPSLELINNVSFTFGINKEWLMTGKGEMYLNEADKVDEKLIDWLNNHPEVIRELRRRSGLD